MKFEDDGINTLTSQVVYRNSLSPSQSPYRLLDPHGQEIDWANDFLDLQHVRGLSSYTLRTYAFSLLHFVRWWINPIPQPLSELKESNLYEYVCHQLRTEPKPGPPRSITVSPCSAAFTAFTFKPISPKAGAISVTLTLPEVLSATADPDAPLALSGSNKLPRSHSPSRRQRSPSSGGAFAAFAISASWP